ncbi:MAG: hypothetical protein QM715_06225 [Nibricoccus sp.]
METDSLAQKPTAAMPNISCPTPDLAAFNAAHESRGPLANSYTTNKPNAAGGHQIVKSCELIYLIYLRIAIGA